MNIPNILSLFRLFLVPIFTYVLVVKDNFLVAGILLIISGITDCCDGYIARKFNMITNLGKILDPLADKLTQLMTVVCLAIKGYDIMWFFAAFLFIKDLALLIGGLLLYKKIDGMVSSNIFGKLATFIFYVAVIILILFGSFLNEIVKNIIVIGIIISCFVALVAYVFKFFSIRSKKIS